MKYLLDTHTLLWCLFEPSKLSSRVVDTVENVSNEILVSILTLWEISLKFSLGKLTLEGITPDKLPEVIEKSGFDILPLSPVDAASSFRLPRLKHQDPFDRLLIWQAIQNNLIFLSQDRKVQLYKEHGLQVLW